MSSTAQDEEGGGIRLGSPFFHATKLAAIPGNSRPDHVSPVLLSCEFSRCRSVGQPQCRVLTDSPRRDGNIGVLQTPKHFNFFRAGYHPQDSSRTIEYRIRQRHAPPLQVDLGQRDITIDDVQHGIARDQRGRVAVFADAEEEFADQAVGMKIQPYRIEAEAKKIAGTTFKVAAPFSSYAIQDGNLITGQQQNSGAAAAELVVKALNK